eukprot:m.951093 g.951093  ORF g.951093 m.951093 type:complete len:75 (+) comp23862_c0_seq2:151-375(+)
MLPSVVVMMCLPHIGCHRVVFCAKGNSGDGTQQDRHGRQPSGATRVADTAGDSHRPGDAVANVAPVVQKQYPRF